MKFKEIANKLSSVFKKQVEVVEDVFDTDVHPLAHLGKGAIDAMAQSDVRSVLRKTTMAPEIIQSLSPVSYRR